MSHYYLAIKHAHIGLAILSGLFFAIRGAFVLAGSAWPMKTPIKRLSYVIDTGLLVAALALLGILHLNPLSTAWLATKLGLLVAYIVCGVFALKRATTTKGKLLAYLLALLCFGMIYLTARSHDPMGFLKVFGG